MTCEEFIEGYLRRGLLKRQKPNYQAVEKLILRAHKDPNISRANLSIDEGTAYTIAYTAMLRAGRALILLKGFRPSDGYQHKTVVEFTSCLLGEKFKTIVERFDKMRKKRNVFTYEIDISISRTEVNNALHIAERFVDLIKDVVKKENPQIEFNF